MPVKSSSLIWTITLIVLGLFIIGVYSDQSDAESPTSSGSCGPNSTWEFYQSTGTLKISGTGETTFDGYVNNIPWYSFKSSIKHVEIGSGMTGIGGFAFDKCYSLESVSFPSTLKKIDGYAFCNCSSLDSLTLPSGLTHIGM